MDTFKHQSQIQMASANVTALDSKYKTMLYLLRTEFLPFSLVNFDHIYVTGDTILYMPIVCVAIVLRF